MHQPSAGEKIQRNDKACRASQSQLLAAQIPILQFSRQHTSPVPSFENTSHISETILGSKRCKLRRFGHVRHESGHGKAEGPSAEPQDDGRLHGMCRVRSVDAKSVGDWCELCISCTRMHLAQSRSRQ